MLADKIYRSLVEAMTPQDGTYICYDVPERDAQMIHASAMRCMPFGEHLPFNDLHCTVIYSKASDYIIPNPELLPETVMCRVKGLTWLGPPGAEDTLVMLLDSPELMKVNRDLLSEHDYVPTFSKYMPHISILKLDASLVKDYPDRDQMENAFLAEVGSVNISLHEPRSEKIKRD